MTKPGRFINEAKKHQEDEGDLEEKFRVIFLLKKYFGLHGLTGEAIAIPRTGWARFPDVFIPAHDPQIAILLHGDAPFHTERGRKEKGVEADYESAGVKLIVIWESTTKYKSEAILHVLDDAGLERTW